MAAPKITITKKLEADLREFSAAVSSAGTCEDGQKIARQLIARIDDARNRKALKEGLSPWEALSIIKRVHPMVVVPPDPGPTLGKLKQKIALLGLTDELVERAALRAKTELRVPLAINYFITQLDVLIAEREEVETVEADDVRVITGRDD